MITPPDDQPSRAILSIPWFGARKLARKLAAENQELRAQRDEARKQLERFGALSVLQLEARRAELQRETAEQTARINRVWTEGAAGALEALRRRNQPISWGSPRTVICGSDLRS